MDLYLYDVKDSASVINKTLENEKYFDITFKDSADISNPKIILKHDGYILNNYAYIPDFKRYYFINRIIVLSKKMIQLELECDVLESFKEDILSSDSQIVQSKESDFFDGDYLQEIRKDHSIYESDVELEFETNIIIPMFRVEE